MIKDSKLSEQQAARGQIKNLKNENVVDCRPGSGYNNGA